MTVLEELINKLKTDTILNQTINQRIYAFSAPLTAIPCLVYTYSPTSADGVKESNKFEIRVIANDLETAYSINSSVKRIFLTVGDTPLTNKILKVSLNGGGTLQDVSTGVVHIISYFTITNIGG